MSNHVVLVGFYILAKVQIMTPCARLFGREVAGFLDAGANLAQFFLWSFHPCIFLAGAKPGDQSRTKISEPSGVGLEQGAEHDFCEAVAPFHRVLCIGSDAHWNRSAFRECNR